MADEWEAGLEKARAMIGKETGYSATREVGRESIRRFAEAVNDHNPLWTDEEYAASTRFGGIIAPPSFVRALVRPPVDVTKHERPKRTSPLPSNKVLNGGVEWEFRAPLRPGDRITAVSRLASIEEKTGKAGKLAIEVTETTYTNQDGQIVAVSRDTVIYR